MSKNQLNLLKIVSFLWVIWGLVHMLAGGINISSDPAGGFQAIADAVPPDALQRDYHPAVGGVLNQHAWNLLWGGLVTVIGAVFIWRGNTTAIWVTGLIGGLLDIGYFMFVDVLGYVNFVPGTVMTIISSSAIVISFSVWRSSSKLPNNG